MKKLISILSTLFLSTNSSLIGYNSINNEINSKTSLSNKEINKYDEPKNNDRITKLTKIFDNLPNSDEVYEILKISTIVKTETNGKFTISVANKEAISNILLNVFEGIVTYDQYIQNTEKLMNSVGYNYLSNSVNSNLINGTNSTKSVWMEIHWYWLGYWKLCFNESVTSKIRNYLNYSGYTLDSIEYYLADILEAIPVVGQIIGALSWIIFSETKIFTYSDVYNCGVWIGFYAVTPTVGWGSISPKADWYANHILDFIRISEYDKKSTHAFKLFDYSDYGSIDNFNYENPNAIINLNHLTTYMSIGLNTKLQDRIPLLYSDSTGSKKISSIKYNSLISKSHKIIRRGLATYNLNVSIKFVNDTKKEQVSLIINDEIAAGFQMKLLYYYLGFDSISMNV